MQKVVAIVLTLLIAAALSLTPVPAVFVAFLLATGAALIIYYFLGGIAESNTVNLSPNTQLAAQVTGSAAVFIATFLVCNYLLERQIEKVITIEPNPSTFMVLSKDGQVLQLTQQTPYQWIGKPISSSVSLRDLPLIPTIDGGDIYIRPSLSSNANVIGRLFGGSDEDPSLFFETLRRDNYYHPLLNALREANCNGEICTDKNEAGFPVIAVSDIKVKPGSLHLVARQSIVDDLMSETTRVPNKTLQLQFSESIEKSKKIQLTLKDQNIASRDLDMPIIKINPIDFNKIYKSKKRHRGYVSF